MGKSPIFRVLQARPESLSGSAPCSAGAALRCEKDDEKWVVGTGGDHPVKKGGVFHYRS
jgi:hypothetical protein